MVCPVLRQVWPLVETRTHAASSLCQIAVSNYAKGCHIGAAVIEAIKEGH